jgi:hypothetical protein
MWTKTLPSNVGAVVISDSAPAPKIKPLLTWPNQELTQFENPPTIAPIRTFLADNYERAIAAIYCEIECNWKRNEISSDPFEKFHFLPVSIELLAKLFECIDINNIPHARNEDDTED